MNIVQITPGAGDNFYCENCLRDVAMARALRAEGHETLLVPLYLPLPDDGGEAPRRGPVFFGAVNVYLQQVSGLFRRTPRWLDKPLDATGLLRWIARRTSATSAGGMGEMTLSMLRGEHGRQVKELRRLVGWLAGTQKPDVICLSNALLIGLARRIKAALGVPVVCLLQDEDAFLDALGRPYARRAWEELISHTPDVDAFIAGSDYYADVMRRRLRLGEGRVHVVRGALDAAGYTPAETPPEAPVVGFLSQMCRGKGLDTLFEVFLKLRSADGLGGLRFRAAGGRTRADAGLHAELARRAQREGLADDVDFLSGFDIAARQRFLRTLSVMSVPTRQPEAAGMYVLEALASGVPVVMPGHGAARELVEATGGGLLVEPNNPDALADGLKELLLDPPRARALGLAGRNVVLREFNINKAAADMIRIFSSAADTIEAP